MSTKIKKGSEGTNFVPPAAGSHVARCIGLIMIGLTDVPYKNEVSKKSLLRLRYELPLELEQFKEDHDKEPWVVEIEFTNTTGTKGNLFKWLTNWSPKINKDNIDDMDLARVIGQPALLNIAHNPSKNDPDKIYLKATGISPVPKGMEVPAQINPKFLFDVEEFDQEKFNTLPKFIRKKILDSEEFKTLNLNPIEVDKIAAEARGENQTTTTTTQQNDGGASADQAAADIGGDNTSTDGNDNFF